MKTTSSLYRKFNGLTYRLEGYYPNYYFAKKASKRNIWNYRIIQVGKMGYHYRWALYIRW